MSHKSGFFIVRLSERVEVVSALIFKSLFLDATVLPFLFLTQIMQ